MGTSATISQERILAPPPFANRSERGVYAASMSAADKPIEPIIPVRSLKRLESRALGGRGRMRPFPGPVSRLKRGGITYALNAVSMKPQSFPRRTGAFTLLELLCVIAIIGILAALLMPALVLAKERAKRMVCLNNEREMGVGFHLFLQDHNSKFPMQVPVSEGGTEDYVQKGLKLGGQFDFSYQLFQVLSNESVPPQELVCPTDTRTAARNMERLRNANLSYFCGVQADYNRPMSILAGNRNVTKQTYNLPSIEELAPGSRLYWTKVMHRYKGDVLFADGHVDEWNQLLLAANTHGTTGREVFFLPTVLQAPAAPAGRTGPGPRAGGSVAGNPGAPVLQQGMAGGGQAIALPPPAGIAGVATPRPDGNGSPSGGATSRGDTRTNPPPPPAATPVPPANPADDSPTNPVPATWDSEAPSGPSFTQSVWWFWLFLLLVLAVLGEAGRRWYRHKHPEPVPAAPDPTYDWPK